MMRAEAQARDDQAIGDVTGMEETMTAALGKAKARENRWKMELDETKQTVQKQRAVIEMLKSRSSETYDPSYSNADSQILAKRLEKSMDVIESMKQSLTVVNEQNRKLQEKV